MCLWFMKVSYVLTAYYSVIKLSNFCDGLFEAYSKTFRLFSSVSRLFGVMVTLCLLP